MLPAGTKLRPLRPALSWEIFLCRPRAIKGRSLAKIADDLASAGAKVSLLPFALAALEEDTGNGDTDRDAFADAPTRDKALPADPTRGGWAFFTLGDLGSSALPLAFSKDAGRGTTASVNLTLGIALIFALSEGTGREEEASADANLALRDGTEAADRGNSELSRTLALTGAAGFDADSFLAELEGGGDLVFLLFPLPESEPPLPQAFSAKVSASAPRAGQVHLTMPWVVSCLRLALGVSDSPTPVFKASSAMPGPP